MADFVVISGCSGGGKSTLLEELRRRGHAVVAEPGRRVVLAQRAAGGRALPWIDLGAFLDRTIALARADLATAAGLDGPVFFDRGLIDALVARAHVAGAAMEADAAELARFRRQVFMAPPWPEIYVTDADRRHGLADAIAEHDRLVAAYPQLGFEVIPLPRTDVAARADFVLERVGERASGS